jgi:IS30 family transposase
VRTVTVDNGTEFHGYQRIEAATGAGFFTHLARVARQT